MNQSTKILLLLTLIFIVTNSQGYFCGVSGCSKCSIYNTCGLCNFGFILQITQATS